MNNNYKVKFSIVNAANDNCIRGQTECTWDKFCYMLENCLIKIEDSEEGKKTNQMVIPCSFNEHIRTFDYNNKKDTKKYIKRVSENLDKMYMLPLDIDDNVTIEEAKERYKKFEYVAYTSSNHALKGKDKFRIFILLETPISGNNLLKRRTAIKKHFGICTDKSITQADDSTLSLTRGFFLPAIKRDDQEFLVWRNHGKLLDWTVFDIEKPVEIKPRQELTVDREKILDQLHNIYVGQEPIWYKIGVAMAECGYDEADFHYVTIGGLMREKDANQCEKKWKKIQTDITKGKTMGGIGFIINKINEFNK